MYQSATLSRSRVIRRNQNTTRYQSVTKSLGPISNALFVAMMVAVVGLIYLTQITKTSEFGYQVDDLKNRRAQLVSENADLEVESARLQALERIRTSDVAKGLEDITSVEFAQ
jgi:cell division protein FtsL